MTRLITLCSCAVLCVASLTGCGSSTAPTVSAPPATTTAPPGTPEVPKNYDGTVKPPTQEEINEHSADGPGN